MSGGIMGGGGSGGAPSDADYLIKTANPSLPNAQVINAYGFINSDIGAGAGIAKSKVSATGSWVDSEIPNLATSKITSGVFAKERIGLKAFAYAFMIYLQWTNMAAALQEFLNTTVRRITVDMTDFTEYRILIDVATAGAAGAVVSVQYSDDGGTTWRGLDNGTAGSLGTTLAINTTGSKITAWLTLIAGAKADRLLRVAGSGGDGALDPVIAVYIQYR